MIVLYDLGIRLYYLTILLMSPFHKKARLWIQGRRGLLEKMRSSIKDDTTPLAWFHASSTGEFEQGRPVMESFRKLHPEYRILLTFFSPSGYEAKKNFKGADYIFYLPLDTAANAKKFIDIVKPSITVFIKYEFWYHFLCQAHRRKTNIILISSIFRPGQVFFRSYGTWYLKMLGFFNQIFVQDQNSADLLASVGISDVKVNGDTRFDRVAEIALQAKSILPAEKFSKDYFVVVCGSTWAKDEDLLCRYINSSNSKMRFIIVPHELHSNHLNSLVQKISRKTVLFSASGNIDMSDIQVLIIDNIGMLSSLYRYGQTAYIGGGFGAGIHNILEAAVYGMPVIFGPNYHNFREARELIRKKGAFAVNDFKQLSDSLDLFFDDHNLLITASQNSKEYVEKNRGACRAIINYLKKA